MGRVIQTDGNKPAPKPKGGKKPIDSASETVQKTVNKDEGITEKKKRRNHPGTVAKREVKRYQRGTELLLQKGPFSRIVRDELEALKSDDGAVWNKDIRVELGCMTELQESTEAYIVNFFRKGMKASQHGKRGTLMDRDLWLVKDLLQGENAFEGHQDEAIA
jgi:histone H3/H4